eukprot:g7470.t1
MMSVSRILKASLVSCLAIAHIGGGDAQTLSSEEDAATTKSAGFVYAVNIVLDEATSPLVLGIRDGQTAAQAAVEFCHEQGLDEDTQAALVPQLIKVLEEGIAEALGPNAPVTNDALSRSSSSAEHTDPNNSDSKGTQDLALDDPILTFGVSLDGEEERMLHYYAGQDPEEVAMAFCAESLVSSTPADEMARCSGGLSAHLAETISAADGSIVAEDLRSEQQQRDEEPQQPQQSETQEQREGSSVREPLMTVPLNINGIETVLEIFRESRAVELGSELCRRAEFGLEGSAMNSCLSQITEIAHRAIAAYNGHDGREELSQQVGTTDPFTFKVPVTLAGLKLHAEFKTSETPRESALRFCTPNLPKIESALGLELHEGENEEGDRDDDTNAPQEGSSVSEGRQSLREACAVIVEDAINAVLLGLRERVMEAEMMRANATDPSDNSQWLQEGGVEAEAWAASPVVADTMG